MGHLPIHTIIFMSRFSHSGGSKPASLVCSQVQPAASPSFLLRFAHLGLRPRCLCCVFLGRANSLRLFAMLGLRPRAFYHIVEGANSLRSFSLRFSLAGSGTKRNLIFSSNYVYA